MKKFLLAIPLLAAIAISCQEKPQEEKESVKIEGVGETVDIPATPEADFTFTIETNVDWSVAKTKLDWLTISPMRGTAKDGVQTIALVAENNQQEESRSGSFTLTAGSTTKKVTVTQAALVVVPNFVVNGIEANTLTFGGEENAAKTFQVHSNKDWTATKANLDWATVSPVSGDKNRQATITVTPTEVNNTGAERTGTISFAYGASQPFVVSVKQAAFVPSLSVNPESLEFAKGGESKNVTITSNTDWTAAASETWVTLGATSGKGNATLAVTAAANEKAARTATVTITAGSLTKTIAISQESGIVAGTGINLETNPVVWCADDQAWNMEHNPEFPGPAEGATGYVATASKHGTGILKPTNDPDKGAYAEFVDGKEVPDDYSAISKGKFIFVAAGSSGSFGDKGGDIGYRKLWINDAVVFHVPAEKISAGKTICFDFSFLGTSACPKFWAAEVKIGGEWKLFHTYQANNSINGVSEKSNGTLAPDAESNVILLTPQRTNSHYDCTYAVTADIPAGELLVRLRVVDPSIQITGSARTSPTDDSTTRFVGWSVEGRSIKDGHGPTIYVK
ncbi:MAG: BACON domain-containing protein [Bacteroidales bacterium]|nr:BACON domain-containing protein [Bacteroidales bacterium]